MSKSYGHRVYKKFVKAKETYNTTSIIDNDEEVTSVCDNKEIKAFYDDTINNEKFKRKKIQLDFNVKSEVVELSDSEESDIEIIDLKAHEELFKASQNGDLESLKSLKGYDIHQTDSYGWTALEVACIMGHDSVVKYLVDKGGYIEPQKKMKLFNLMKSKGHENEINIMKIVNGSSSLNTKDEIVIVDESCNTPLERCKTCDETFLLSQKSKHISSIAHQIVLTKNISKRNPGFILSENNVGYRIMKKSGWDGYNGLGKCGKGKLFPVKTVLKQDRRGITSGDRKKMRITHFKPHDPESIAGTRRVKRKQNIAHKIRRKQISKSDSDQIFRQSLGDL